MTELSAEAKAARRAYKSAWQRKNRDKCREYERRYWERKAAKEKENTPENVETLEIMIDD